MITLKVVVVFMALASYISMATARCCGGCPLSSRCSDGTGCTPFINCCATGRCNWFCCNCGGVCRRSSIMDRFLSRAQTEEEHLNVAMERFGQLDKNKNGAIENSELREFIPSFALESAIQEIDVNSDGKITIEEFDEDAGRSLKQLKLLQ